MRIRINNLVGICLLSLAALGAMMVPGMLMLPTLVSADGTFTGLYCQTSGVTGCTACVQGSDTPALGCENPNPSQGFPGGTCEPATRYQSCTALNLDCGQQLDCTQDPWKATGQWCARAIPTCK
jgi:hypothetical protein